MTHKEWMLSLKVGDTVNDCRFQTHTIAAIEEVRMNKVQVPTFLLWVPLWLFDALRWVSSKLFGTEVVDKDIVLEDGSQCSAMHCCDPVEDPNT